MGNFEIISPWIIKVDGDSKILLGFSSQMSVFVCFCPLFCIYLRIRVFLQSNGIYLRGSPTQIDPAKLGNLTIISLTDLKLYVYLTAKETGLSWRKLAFY